MSDDGYNAGYNTGYNAGYSNAVTDLIRWLLDHKHPEAAQALRYALVCGLALSPEDVAAMNEGIRELYAALQKLAEEPPADV